MILKRFVEGMDERVGGASFVERSLRKVFPDHWAFMLGEIAMYCFVILVLTGTFLSLFYVASSQPVTYDGPYAPLRGQEVSAAFDSVMRISFEVRAGLVMRQIHHWAAVLFVAAIVFHMIRVFFTGAFRKPRDINWLVGFSLFLLGIFAGFTGYSLPDDLLSGTVLRIAYSVVLSIPLIGTWMAYLLFGGEFPAPELLNRLLVIHIMILPALIAGAMATHVALVWRQKHTQFRAPGRTEDTVEGTSLWPNYGMKALGLMFCVFAVLAALGGLAQINPIWLYGPFVPYSASSPAQPDWYMGWLEGAVRLAGPWSVTVFGHTIGELFWPGVVFPGLFFTIVAAWPFVEARVTGDHDEHHFLQRPREMPLRSAVGAAGLTLMSILTIAGSNDVMARLFDVEVDQLNVWLRWGLLVLPLAVAFVVFRACRELGERDVHPVSRPKRLEVRWSQTGGFEESEDATEPASTAPERSEP
jgi:ubiquinol-cytochrome c reductase cytochrome b subunit